jgi:hypothetical protein
VVVPSCSLAGAAPFAMAWAICVGIPAVATMAQHATAQCISGRFSMVDGRVQKHHIVYQMFFKNKQKVHADGALPKNRKKNRMSVLPHFFFSARAVQKRHQKLFTKSLCRKPLIITSFIYTKNRPPKKMPMPVPPQFFVLSRLWVFLSEGQLKNATTNVLQKVCVESLYKKHDKNRMPTFSRFVFNRIFWRFSSKTKAARTTPAQGAACLFLVFFHRVFVGSSESRKSPSGLIKKKWGVFYPFSFAP